MQRKICKGVLFVLSFVLILSVSTIAADSDVNLKGVFLSATWGTATQELAKEYEELTGVKVNIELIGRGQIYEKMALELASRSPSYDIFNIDYNWLPQFAEAGYLLPIDNLITDETNYDGFLDKAVDFTCKWDGKLYGFPQTIHPHLLWYRKDLLNNEEYQKEFEDKYGYELNPPKTMEEWHDVVEFFNGKDTDGDGKADLYGWAAQASKGFGNVHTWLSFLFSFGGRAFDYDTMKPTLTSPEAIKATKFWADMMKFTPPGINSYTFAEVTQDAASGKLATALHWSWSAWEVDDPEISKTVGDWEFVQVPKQVKSAPHLAGWSIVINKFSKYPEEAFKFIEWLESKENDVRQALMGAGDPVRASSYNDPRLLEAKIEGTDVPRFRRYDEVKVAMENTMPRPRIIEEEQWEVIVSKYLHAIQLGEMSVEKALEAANKEVEEMMRRSGYYK